MRTSKLLLAVLAAGVVAAACGPGATDGAATTGTPTPADTATASPPPGSPTPTPPPVASPSEDAARIEVADGQVVGGPPSIVAAVGEEVTVVVSSDTTDTVHLHGYDIEVPVAPAQPATLTVTADIPGVFEIELEDAGLKIAELEVRG